MGCFAWAFVRGLFCVGFSREFFARPFSRGLFCVGFFACAFLRGLFAWAFLRLPSSANGVQNRPRAKTQEGEITKSKDLVSDKRKEIQAKTRKEIWIKRK